MPPVHINECNYITCSSDQCGGEEGWGGGGNGRIMWCVKEQCVFDGKEGGVDGEEGGVVFTYLLI